MPGAGVPAAASSPKSGASGSSQVSDSLRRTGFSIKIPPPTLRAVGS
uniref:Zinc finger protein 638 n=1 Tax=Mus musculus TaxID=10090 RepID=A0A0N4SVU0_MOUSE